MNLLNKLLCKLFGHKFVPKLKDLYCTRCGVSRPKTFSEYLNYDSLYAKYFSKERYQKHIFDDLQQVQEISQKKWKGDIKDIDDIVTVYDYRNRGGMMKFEKLEIELDKSFLTDKEELKGRIRFRGEQYGDWINLGLDEEWCKKILEVSLPLIGKATNERIEIIRKEVGLSKKVDDE